ARSNLPGHESERPAVRVAVCGIPVRVVQHVERLDAEFNALGVFDRHALAQAEIEIPRGRIAKQVAWLHTERARGRPGERGGVEPGRGRFERAPRNRRIADQIPELTSAARADTGEVVFAADRDRRARLMLIDARDLPVAAPPVLRTGPSPHD